MQYELRLSFVPCILSQISVTLETTSGLPALIQGLSPLACGPLSAVVFPSVISLMTDISRMAPGTDIRPGVIC